MADLVPYVARIFFVGKRPGDDLPVIVVEKILNRDGRSLNLATSLCERRQPLSFYIHALSTASQGLANLHERGLIHGDCTLSNIVPNQQDEGVIVDNSAMCSLNDKLEVRRDSPEESYYLAKEILINGKKVWFDLPYVDSYANFPLVCQALENGQSLTVIDQYSFGVCLLEILKGLGFVDCNSCPGNIVYARWVLTRFESLGGNIPSSLSNLVWLINQLLDLANPSNKISMSAVAKILQQLVSDCQAQLDC